MSLCSLTSLYVCLAGLPPSTEWVSSIACQLPSRVTFKVNRNEPFGLKSAMHNALVLSLRIITLEQSSQGPLLSALSRMSILL